MTKLVIFILSFFVCMSCFAQGTINTITFTWYTDGGNLIIGGTANEEFTIDWGDGTIETKTPDVYKSIIHNYATMGKYTVIVTGSTSDCRFTTFYFNPPTVDYQTSSLTLTGCSDLERLFCDNGQLQELDLTGCPKLAHLSCSYHQITNLDLSGCPKLTSLYCVYNQLTNLDLTGCPDLQSLTCYNNRLQLSDLFAAHFLTDDQSEKRFGTQNLQPQIAIIGEALFSEQSVFNGIFTNYSVIQDDNSAPESDYTVIDGKLIFNAVGKYTVIMTNDAIVSINPARVIVEITVEKGAGIAEPKQNNLAVYPNPASTEIHVKLNSHETANYTIYNTVGQTVLQGRLQEETTINVKSLSKGIYYINLNDKENTTVSFIKN
jgi:hypothetical protein